MTTCDVLFSGVPRFAREMREGQTKMNLIALEHTLAYRGIAMRLDDATAIENVDRSGMLYLMEKTPDRLTAPSDWLSTCGKDLERPSNVVFGGLGGSGIIGDIMADYLRELTDIPVSVCRTTRIPRIVGKKTLFVTVSYSGETQETLDLFAQAKAMDMMMVSIGSGGQLISQSRREGIAHLRVIADLPPRVALPELVAAAVFALERAAVIKDASKLLSETSRWLSVQIGRLKPSIPSEENYAKQMAQALDGKIPLLMGDEENVSVLRRFKNELNENSKVPALYYTLPEAYHNDVEGLRVLGQFGHVQPVLLHGHAELEGQKHTHEKLIAVLRELGFPATLPFEGLGNDRLSYLLTAITFGDYVSAYLAVLRGIDPSEPTLIPKFKEARRRQLRWQLQVEDEPNIRPGLSTINFHPVEGDSLHFNFGSMFLSVIFLSRYLGSTSESIRRLLD